MKGKENECAAVRLGKSRLMVAMAILAVAFVVLAAAPAALMDNSAEGDAPTVVYVDKTLTTDASPCFNTLSEAIEALKSGGTVYMKTDTAGTETKAVSVTQAITIKSYGTTACKIGVAINATAALTLENVEVAPQGVVSDVVTFNKSDATLIVKDCTISIKGNDDTRANGILVSSASSVSITGTTFKNVDGANYVRGMMIFSTTGDVDIKDNEATGLHVFAATSNVATKSPAVLTVTGNSSTAMTGDIVVGGETKDSKFLQLAGGSVYNKVVVGGDDKAKNTVSSASGKDVPYVNIHDSQAHVKDMTVDQGMKVTGALTLTGNVTVGGEIQMAYLEKSNTKAEAITMSSGILTINGGLTGDKTASIMNNATVANNSSIAMAKHDSDAASYSGTGTFIAGSGSTATIKYENQPTIVGTGKVNGETPKTEAEASTSDYEVLKALLDAGTPSVKLSNDVTLAGDLTVESTTTLNFGGASLVLGKYTLFVQGGTIQYGALKHDSDDACITFKSSNDQTVSGNFKVSAASDKIEIDAEKIQGSFDALRGTAVISGKVTGGFGVTKTNGSIQFLNLTVNSGVTLTLGGDATLQDTKGNTFNLYGALATTEKRTITVSKNATFKAFSGSQIDQKITVDGTGTIDLSQAQNPQTVGEDISADKTYGQLEYVTVVGSLTIKNGAKVTVLGGFELNEGVTLTIQKGSELIINSKAASMIVNGEIVVEEGAKLTVTSAQDVKVSGAIESNGTFVIASAGSVTVKSGGYILIDDATESSFSVAAGLTVESGAALIVESEVNGSTVISNKGSVILDGATLGGILKVSMLGSGAIFQVESVSGAKQVTITDEGLKFTSSLKVGSAEGQQNTANTVIFTPAQNTAIKGFVITETVSSYTYNGTTYYYNYMDLSGSVAVEATADGTTIDANDDLITASGKYLTVSGDLVLGKNVGLTLTGEMSVSGTIIATEDGSRVVSADENNKLAVSGLVQVKTKIDKISAAMYESKIGTTTVYNYTTLKDALDSGAITISVFGEISVSENLTIPTGTTVKESGTITVGSSSNTDVVLTVEDGASVKNVGIDVKGTLIFENKKNNGASKIESDVSVIGDVSSKYTNLYTALSEAQSGDTVTIDRETVSLSKDITVKEGVVLEVPNSKYLKVGAGVTINVVGVLVTAEKIQTDDGVNFALSADKLTKKAAIVVSGAFLSGAELTYDYYQTPGAYFTLTDDLGVYNYVTTLETASVVSANPVGVYGKVSAGNVAFTGTSSSTKTITVYGDLTISSITLDKAKLVFSGGRISGDVKVADSAITVKNVAAPVSIDSKGVMVVESAALVSLATGDKASFKVSAGTVHITASTVDVTVASGATLASSSTQTNLSGKLTVEGTVSVANEQYVYVSGVVTVKGTLSVADSTDSKSAGVFKVGAYLYIGLTSSDVVKTTGAEAAVSGPIDNVSVAFVKSGASVSDATLESFKNSAGVLVSTTYSIEGKEWMTVYDRSSEYYIDDVDNVTVENGEFDCWTNSEGTEITNEKIGASKCTKVTAKIDYEIYNLYVLADTGIENIAVDGNLMTYGLITDGTISLSLGYIATGLKAGSHTISYTLKNGYSGTAKLALVDSGDATASVSGMGVSISGSAGKVTLQLTGIEKSGYVDPVQPVKPKEDDGLKVTDYLLIVLVILVVILAVIVALRLMRS